MGHNEGYSKRQIQSTIYLYQTIAKNNPTQVLNQ